MIGLTESAAVRGCYCLRELLALIEDAFLLPHIPYYVHVFIASMYSFMRTLRRYARGQL